MAPNSIIGLIFTVVTAFGVLLQACVLLGMYFGARKALIKVNKLADEMRVHALPLMANARGLVEDVSPKIKMAASDLVDATGQIRHQTRHVTETVNQVTNRTRNQAERVDDMVSGTLDNITHAVDTVQNGVSGSVRQITGLLHGIRAGVGNFSRKRDEN